MNKEVKQEFKDHIVKISKVPKIEGFILISKEKH